MGWIELYICSWCFVLWKRFRLVKLGVVGSLMKLSRGATVHRVTVHPCTKYTPDRFRALVRLVPTFSCGDR